jgi:aspartate carbamoyltransferase catalytic subunit
MHIAMVGDLKNGRTVHSLSKLLALYKNVKVSLVSPGELAMPDYVIDTLENAGHQVIVSDRMEDNIEADIVYQTRIQEERFASQDEANKYRGQFRLNNEIYTKYCKSNTVIMHPLPRDSRSDANELDNDLNQNPNLAIFRQADNGVLIRMALFAMTLGVANKVDQYQCDVPWITSK